MRHEIVAVVTGTVIDEKRGVPLAQLCRACGLSPEDVVAMVEEGILEPVGKRRGHWLFPADSIRRARTAIRLQRDLELNRQEWPCPSIRSIVSRICELTENHGELTGEPRSFDLQDHDDEVTTRARNSAPSTTPFSGSISAATVSVSRAVSRSPMRGSKSCRMPSNV